MSSIVSTFFNKLRNKMNILTKGGTTTINGVSYQGSNIRIENGILTIDGKRPSQVMDHNISIQVNGDVESIDAGSGRVTVAGNATNISTGSGNVKCGDADGNVQTGSGNITCKNIKGSVRTGSGNISCESQNDI